MPFNVGPMELIIVLVIALLILGPGKLPEVGAAFGKTIREFRKASSDIQETANLATSPSAPAAPVAQAAAVAPAPAPVAPVAPAPNTLSDQVAPNSLSAEPAPLGTPADPVEERA
jgi:TatA/E family protein of Tat protein translocase